MRNSNKKRLIQNVMLIAVIVALAVFLWAQKESAKNDKSNFTATLYDDSIGDEATEILIHVKGRDDVLLKNIDDTWRVVQPEEFIADKEQVQHLFTIFSENADTSYTLEGKDLTDFGLDEDRLSVSFNNVKLIFGEYNPVSQKRYILKGETMYLVSETITGLLQGGADAFRLKEVPESTAPAVTTPISSSQSDK